jgi:RNA polymerase sigma-54 factor
MKQVLQLRQGQQLTMTPQMQQAIRLLQIPAAELKAEIQDALESNVMLELEEEEGEVTVTPREAEPYWDGPGSDWARASPSPGPGAASDEWQAPEPTTLYDHLHWQLDLTPFGPVDRAIAEVLIDGIDDDGYLHAELADLRAALPRDMEVTDGDMEAVLHRIQHFDPVGVGARTLAECLSIQLAQLQSGPVTDLAIRIADDHLEDLASGKSDKLPSVLDEDADTVEEAIELIRSLNPRPGTGLASADSGYTLPDVVVMRDGGEWSVELNPELLPKLRINPYYEQLATTRNDAEERACLKGHLQEARWLLRNLRTRADTLVLVADFIVRHQREWLLHGDTAMKPLILRDVSEALDLHESTVSRATAGKYLLTPRGMFEFRHFFSNELNPGSGASATAVRAQIRRLIDGEEPGKPLSDSRIATLLSEMGLQVARRTVAKYRESMAIPATPERRAMRHTP